MKLWAKHHGINEARNQTLSSYTLTLMMIHYLQAGVRPQVSTYHTLLLAATFYGFVSGLDIKLGCH